MKMDFMDRSEFLKFDLKEVWALVLFSLLTGFLFSFNDWGTNTFSLSEGLLNLQKAIISVFVVTFTVVLLIKLIAINKGFYVKIRFNVILTLFSFLITFLFFGIVSFPAFLNYMFEYDEKIRFGEPKIMPLYEDYSKISSLVLMFNILLSLVLFFMFSHEKYFFQIAFSQIFNVLPVPFIPGYYAFINGKSNFLSFVKTYLWIGVVLLLLFLFI